MQIDTRGTVRAGLVTLGAALVLGLVVALVGALTGTDLGTLYTPVLLIAGAVGAVTLGRGGGASRLVAHLVAPLAGGVVAALVLALVLEDLALAWAARPLVWLTALTGGLVVWLLRTVDWRPTVRTSASEWWRVTGSAAPTAPTAPPAPPVGPVRPAGPSAATSGRPAYGAYADTAAPAPAAPAPAGPAPAGGATPAGGLRTAGYLSAVAWGAGTAVLLGVLGNITDLPLGVVGSVAAGAVAAGRVPATPASGLGRYVGAATIASVVGTLVVVLLPGSSGLLPAAALGAVAGVVVGLVRKRATD